MDMNIITPDNLIYHALFWIYPETSFPDTLHIVYTISKSKQRFKKKNQIKRTRSAEVKSCCCKKLKIGNLKYFQIIVSVQFP